MLRSLWITLLLSGCAPVLLTYEESVEASRVCWRAGMGDQLYVVNYTDGTQEFMVRCVSPDQVPEPPTIEEDV